MSTTNICMARKTWNLCQSVVMVIDLSCRPGDIVYDPSAENHCGVSEIKYPFLPEVYSLAAYVASQSFICSSHIADILNWSYSKVIFHKYKAQWLWQILHGVTLCALQMARLRSALNLMGRNGTMCGCQGYHTSTRTICLRSYFVTSFL